MLFFPRCRLFFAHSRFKTTRVPTATALGMFDGEAGLEALRVPVLRDVATRLVVRVGCDQPAAGVLMSSSLRRAPSRKGRIFAA